MIFEVEQPKVIQNPYLLPQFKVSPLMNVYNPNQFINFCAIDIGYHGVKIVTEEGLSFIPNVVCPKKEIGNVTANNPKRIAYSSERDEFFVGDLAFDLSENGDIRSNDRYSLNFIRTAEFLALFRCSVYLATKGNPEPKVATGLPSLAFKGEQTYVEQLKKILVGRHEFQIAMGSDVGSKVRYKTVVFTIRPDSLLIYPQPIGTLASQAMSIDDGKLKETNINLLEQNDDKRRTIIDGGFYTVDIHTMIKGTDVSKYSFSLAGNGMIEPYQKIADKIKELTKMEDFEGVDKPIWKLSELLEKQPPYTVDNGGEEPLDVTADVQAILSEYGLNIAKKLYSKECLNRTIEIHEIYLTGGTAHIFMNEFPNVFQSHKLKIAKCILNGVEIEPRYFNVIGYFYLLLIVLQSELQLLENEVATTSESSVGE